MDTPTEQRSELNEQIKAAYADDSMQSLQQLLSGTRELYAETAGQVRNIGELAFMELELAVSSFQWMMLALALFCVTCIMTFTFIVAAALIAIANTAYPPIVMLLVMAGLCIGLACCLFMWLKVLSRKMTFSTLRNHLTRPQVASHVDTRL
jgi:hypothetical protein